MKIKKPWGLRPINLNPVFEISYIDLCDHFILKTYSPTPTTWSTSMTQQLPIAL